MLHIPPITAPHARPKRRLYALQRRIAMTHDRLPEVIEAVRQVLGGIFAFAGEAFVVLVFVAVVGHGVENTVVQGEFVHARHDHVQAVQLVGGTGGVDGFVVFYVGRGQEGVGLRFGDFDEAETLCGCVSGKGWCGMGFLTWNQAEPEVVCLVFEGW